MHLKSVAGSAVVILLWWLVTYSGLINEVFLPPPWVVFGTLFELLISNSLTEDILATAWRTILGFSIGSLVGISMGLIIASYSKAYEILEFPIDFFRSIPATAIFPLFIAIWGLGDEVKIIITAWASCLVMLINTIYGVKNSSPVLLMVAQLKRLSIFRTFLLIKLPGALPHIVAGARTALSFSLVVQIVAEMFLGSNIGLGKRIFNATSIFEMNEAYAIVIVVGILGYTLNKSMLFFEERFIHWRGK